MARKPWEPHKHGPGYWSVARPKGSKLEYAKATLPLTWYEARALAKRLNSEKASERRDG